MFLRHTVYVIPIRLFFKDNFRNDSGPFNDELGINSSRLLSNFSSCKITTKPYTLYYIFTYIIL